MYRYIFLSILTVSIFIYTVYRTIDSTVAFVPKWSKHFEGAISTMKHAQQKAAARSFTAALVVRFD